MVPKDTAPNGWMNKKEDLANVPQPESPQALSCDNLVNMGLTEFPTKVPICMVASIRDIANAYNLLLRIADIDSRRYNLTVKEYDIDMHFERCDDPEDHAWGGSTRKSKAGKKRKRQEARTENRYVAQKLKNGMVLFVSCTPPVNHYVISDYVTNQVEDHMHYDGKNMRCGKTSVQFERGRAFFMNFSCS